MVKTGARASQLAAMLLRLGHVVSDSKRRPPRVSDLDDSAAQLVLSSYRKFGGSLVEPVFRPGPWDLAFTNDLIVELDEELHFNRYRARTLIPDLPWAMDYMRFADEHESECLRAGRWGLRWTSPSTVRSFGQGDEPGTLGERGAPRWKQRALYDLIKDAAPGISLARLSVHDSLGKASLHDVLTRGVAYDEEDLADLVRRRTTHH
jgi:hypothetical protein